MGYLIIIATRCKFPVIVGPFQPAYLRIEFVRNVDIALLLQFQVLLDCSWYNERVGCVRFQFQKKDQVLKSSPQTCGQQACLCNHLRLAYHVEGCSGLGFLKLVSLSSMPKHQFLFDVHSLFGPSCIESHPKPKRRHELMIIWDYLHERKKIH